MAAIPLHIFVNQIIWWFSVVIIILMNSFLGIPSVTMDFLNQYIFTLENIILITIGGFIFDIDHIFYYGLTTQRPKIKNMIKRMQDDFVTENPHPYVFHSFEFVIVFAIILGIFDPLITSESATEVFYNFMIVLLGWIIHLCVDIIGYIKHYKSSKPWLSYFSMINLLIQFLKRKPAS